MDIAELHEAESIQSGWEMRQGDVNGHDAIPQPSRCGAIPRRQAGQTARPPNRVAEDGVTRRLNPRPLRHWQGRHGRPRAPLEAFYCSHGEKTETRRNQPESDNRSSPRPKRPTREDTDPQQVERHRQDDERGHDQEPLQ